MNIKGRFVTLRAATREDQQMMVDMFNDPELENYVVGWTFPMSIESQLQYFEKHLGDAEPHRFVVETEADGALGIATLDNIDWKNRCADHGLKLALREHRSRGVGTDAVMALMRYAFDELGLHRLDGGRFPSNVASGNLYKKCGWSDEGVRRQCVFKRGEWRDVIYMGITEPDYRKLVAENGYWD